MNLFMSGRNQSLYVKLFAVIKFTGDRLAALLLIVLTAPLMLLIALAIKLEGSGPVLFKQERTGKFGKVFNIYKFRTMVSHNDVHDNSRPDEYTKLGKLLRRLSLDELPQLFMILFGKMSFIGPRPWIHSYYENMTDEQRRRYDVRPGLTGLAQVMGRNNISIFEKIAWDLYYIENYSFRQELKIFLMTITTVLGGSGVDSGKETIHDELESLKNHKYGSLR